MENTVRKRGRWFENVADCETPCESTCVGPSAVGRSARTDAAPGRTDGHDAVLAEVVERLRRIEEKLGTQVEPEERFWAPEEIARKVGRAPLTVREWARLKKIPSRKDSHGRRWISDQIARLIFRYQGLPPEEELVPLAKA